METPILMSLLSVAAAGVSVAAELELSAVVVSLEPLQAIVIGEFVINIIFFGFIALGAPTAIQDVITGLALLIIITLTTKVTKGEIVK